MQTNYLIKGKITPEGLIKPQETLPVPEGEVQILIPIPDHDVTQTRNFENLWELVETARKNLSDSGFRFRSGEEIDKQIRELRDEWE